MIDDPQLPAADSRLPTVSASTQLSTFNFSTFNASSPAGVRFSTISALFMRSRARATPSPSIASPVSRSPAVSTRRTGQPPMSNHSSIESRVVPGVAETIARLSPRRAFRSELFPAFGGPAITTRAPSRRIFPSLARRIASSRREAIEATEAAILSRKPSGNSSSLTSSACSAVEERSTRAS